VSTLIIGCGYLGRAVARELLAAGEAVFGTTRSAAKAAELAAAGITPIVADVLDESGPPWPAVDRVFHAVGFDRSSGVPVRRIYLDGLNHALARLSIPPRNLVYASTTGVYGQTDGSWVNEDSPTGPRGESGRACLEAEGIVRAFSASLGVRSTSIRFAGLYGPGRLIGRGAIERGEPIDGDADHILNLIHVEDAARFTAAALLREPPGDRYVLSDDRPVSRRAFYGLAAACLGRPAPGFRQPPPDAPKSSRDATNKRVDSRRIKRDLGLSCRYPDITTGIPASIGRVP
jgi:nucleoside-diphosphate-sugar epimerase